MGETPPIVGRIFRSTRVAVALWVAWAIILWNVVLDHVIVVAGRRYLHAAAEAARGAPPYPRMDDWMRPAVRQGVWMATLSAVAVLVVGLALVRVARRNSR